MNLTASLVVRNELGRYLELCIDHLLEFCDTVVVLDDASDDGTQEWLNVHPDPRVHFAISPESTFFRHEGQTRQHLLNITLAQNPSHVLALDADEFVSNGAALRNLLTTDLRSQAWSLLIEEVWDAHPDSLSTREDGGWRQHPLPTLWRRVPDAPYQILNKQLACHRIPVEAFSSRLTTFTELSLLHFGWTDLSTREQRYDRYANHDGGRFHARAHIESIRWPEGRVKLQTRAWPAGAVFDELRERLAPVPA